jgi:hypothetical protein
MPPVLPSIYHCPKCRRYFHFDNAGKVVLHSRVGVFFLTLFKRFILFPLINCAQCSPQAMLAKGNLQE